WTTDDFFDISRNMEIFGKTYTEVNAAYVEEPDPTALMRTAINAMLASLDPYTNYYGESIIEDSRVINTGQYSGIGAEVDQRKGVFVLMELYKGGPADLAGLKVGDRLTGIDNEVVDSARTREVVNNLLLGEKGKPVRLTISRPGEDSPRSVTVVRGGTEEQQENVPYYGMATEKFGYILLSGFMQDAGKEVADALAALKKDHPDLAGVVLDVRFNPGGRLDEAVNVCNVFMPQGEKIVEMRGRARESQNMFYTLRSPVDTEIPLVVLVNSRSASASEIVAGSIQDLDRGVIVGQRSFGKGLVQNVRPVTNSTQMKITIAKYYTPSGRCIQAIDYSGKLTDGVQGRIPDSLVKAFTTRNGRPVYDGGGVEPDMPAALPARPSVVRALEEQGLIFDFVSEFVANKTSIGEVRSFSLDEAEYSQFVNWCTRRGFTYETPAEQQLDVLEARLKKEHFDQAMKDEIVALRRQMEEQKSQDLRTYQTEISRLLRLEIINRFYYKEGVIEASFKDDPDMKVAIQVLSDPLLYRDLLRKKP
ncbi:MAG: S41 family peptidase, partial [Bacteroidetes bacterium]